MENSIHRKKNLMGRLFDLIIYPEAFFAEFKNEKGGTGQTFLFLGTCAIFFSILSILFSPGERTLIMGAVYFINGFCMPFITGFLVYLTSIVFCRGVFKYHSLFRITAYSNITLMMAWIPGVSWLTGIWNYYLIWSGMMAIGDAKKSRVFLSLLSACAIILAAINIIQSLT